MSVIGTLTVNLEANTATFSGDLGKAAKSAEDFGKTASAAGKQVDYSMMEAKGSMMLLGEELGVHIPRHLQTLIAGIPAVGAAFAEMLPIVGVVAAIAIIAKLVEKNEEAKEKLAQGWDKFGVETETVFSSLDDKMLQVGKRADELAGRHLEALRKELELIDHASLRELATEFGKLEKAGHTLMVEMKSSWYEIRMGSQGAENALTRFTGEYDLLLAKGDKKGAFDKLVGTLGSANEELKKMTALEGTMYAPSQKHVEAQRLLVSILEDQLRVTKEVDAINAGEKGNKKTEQGQAEAGRQHAVYEEQQKGLEQRRKAEERYAKERAHILKEAAKEDERMAEEQMKATEAVAAEHEKVLKRMADEETRHAEVMAALNARDGGESKRGEEKRYQEMKDALQRERQLLTSTGEQWVADEQKIHHKEEEEAQKHQNRMHEITRRGEQQRADLAKEFAHLTLFERQGMAAALEQLGKRELSELINNTLQGLIVREDAAAREKLLDAEGSATSAFKWAMKGLPFPINAMVAPIAAATAFAGVMAFEQGGEIPGYGAVPILAHGGETVVTKALTDQVKGNVSGGRHHVTINMGDVHAVDAEHFGGLMKKHAALISKHVSSELRKQNR